MTCAGAGIPPGSSGAIHTPLNSPELGGEMVFAFQETDVALTVTAPVSFTTEFTLTGGSHAAHQLVIAKRDSSLSPGSLEVAAFA